MVEGLMRQWLWRTLLPSAIAFVLGAALFSGSQPRSVYNLRDCQGDCLAKRDAGGALASLFLRHAPSLTPLLLEESERCVAVRHWKPRGDFHRVYLPKRDVRNIMELAQEDVPYLLDCLALANRHLAQVGLRNYRVLSNGPESQHVTYFHFHVISVRPGEDTP
jgi:diadenosine tetraphosphate (Ap4A) HIT family hydrolase